MSDNSTARLRRALEAFSELVDLDEPERAKRLALLAEQDDELTEQVRQLLAQDQVAESAQPSATEGPGPAERTPDWPESVGRYALEERLGEGGAGIVYRARPVRGEPRHAVAIKILKATDEHVLAYFASERRILGGLEHPYVARLLETGTTGDGRPWIAMELVDGVPIVGYADAKRLGVKGRLALFLRVMEGVDYAHSQLIVHLDLKPSNILVTERGEPKLLDFGIAAELAAESRPRTAAFTPNYASPEQLLGERPTPAADVYSLGVLLCELLSGSRPARSVADSGVDLAEALRSSPVPSPSGLVLAAEEGGRIAEARRSTRRRLARQLSGDLDAIVQLALAPDPGKRYRSVAAFAADIESWLGRRPVSARVRGPLGRAGLAISRYKLASTGAIAAILIVTALSLQSAAVGRARSLAEKQRARAERLLDELVETLSVVNPWRREGEEWTAASFLEAAATRASHLDAESGVRSLILSKVGDLERALGRSERAVELLEEAKAAAPGDVERLRIDESLVDALLSAGKIEEAVALAQEVVSRRRERFDSAPLLLPALVRLAEALYRDSREEEARFAIAEQVAREAVALAGQIEAGADPANADRLMAARARLALSTLLWRRGKYEEAGALAQTSAEQLRAMGRGGALLEESVTMQGLVALAEGRFAAAVDAFERVADQVRELLGEEHPLLADSLNNLGAARELQGEPARAVADLRQAVAIADGAYPPEHANRLAIRANLAHVLVWNGGAVEGERIYREIRGAYSSILPPEHPFLPLLDAMIAESLSFQGRHREALALLPTMAESADFLPTLTRSIAAGVRAAAAERPSPPDLEILQRTWKRLQELQGDYSISTRDAAERLARATERAAAPSG
ncbi:MAG: protein kinase [Thermoanaerobaculia bacterium]